MVHWLHAAAEIGGADRRPGTWLRWGALALILLVVLLVAPSTSAGPSLVSRPQAVTLPALPPLAPGLGPSPPPCTVLVYGDTSCVLQSFVGTFSLSPHIVRAGDLITGTLARHCPRSCLGGWDWRGTAIPGDPVTPCRNSIDTTCTWLIPKNSTGTPWTVAILNYGTWAGHAESRDFYAVLGHKIAVLEGTIVSDSGTPITNTDVLIAGPSSYYAKTDLNGYYNAFLDPGDYTVTPRVNPQLMDPGATIKPVSSSSCIPSADSCLVHLGASETKTANFTVPACHILPDKLDGWTLKAPCPAHPEDGVANVQITPPDNAPSGLEEQVSTQDNLATVSSGAATLTYNLPMVDRADLLLPVELPDMTLRLGSISLAAEGVSLDDSGLSIDAAGFDLNLPIGQAQGELYDINVAADGAATADSLELDIAGATVDANQVSISASGISAGPTTIALPEFLGGQTAQVTGFSIGADGSVSGSFPASFRLGNSGIHGTADTVTLSSAAGITVDRAQLYLPITGGNLMGFTIGFTYNGQQIALLHGGASIQLSPIQIGKLRIDATAMLTLQNAGDAVTYDFQGKAKLEVPGEFPYGLNAALDIGSFAPPACTNLRDLNLAVNGPPVEIGDTGLELTGLSGGLATECPKTAGGSVTYTITLGATVQTLPSGLILQGTVTGFLGTDGTVGLLVSPGRVLKILSVTGGICARFVAGGGQYICTHSLLRHAAACQAGVGVCADVNGSASWSGAGSQVEENNQPITNANALLSIDAYGMLLHAEGQAYIQATISGTGSLTLPPLATLSGTVSGVFGRFTTGLGGEVLGLKAEIEANISTSKDSQHAYQAIFIDQNGTMSVTNTNVYTLTTIPPPPGPTALSGPPTPGRVDAALAGPEGVAAAAPPPTSSTRSGVFQIQPGQTQTFMSLSWQAGTPSLTLIAPDHHAITPQHVGPGVALIPATAGNTVVLYLPKPQPGRWHIQIGNLHGGENAAFTMTGTPPTPSLSVSRPRLGQTLLARPGQPAVILVGRLRGAGAGGRISLFYTTTRTVMLNGQVSPNYGGALLAGDVPVQHGAWHYSWNTSTVPAGHYFIYAQLDNGTGPPVDSFAPGSVTVLQAKQPATPRQVQGVQRGAVITVQWRPPAVAGPIAGYQVRYRPTTIAAQPWLVLDVGSARRVVLSGLDPSMRYAVEVATYDITGAQSAWIPAHLSGGPTIKPAGIKAYTAGKTRAHHTTRQRAERPAATAPATLPVHWRTPAAGTAPLRTAGHPAIAIHSSGMAATDTTPADVAPETARQGSSTIPIFVVYYTVTPQIAINDVAAITGRDYSTMPSMAAQTWRCQTVRGQSGKQCSWQPYRSTLPAPEDLTYALYAEGPNPTDNQRLRYELATDRRRHQAGCTPTPFSAGGAADAANTHKPQNWDPSWTSCDEYPFASTLQGGSHAIIRGVPIAENRSQGGQFAQFVDKNAVALADNYGKFQVCVIGVPNAPYKVGECA